MILPPPLQAAPLVLQSPSQWDPTSGGSVTGDSVQIPIPMLPAQPILLFMSWLGGAATPVISDTAGNTYSLLISKNISGSYVSLYYCASALQNADQSRITITVALGVSVTNFFLTALQLGCFGAGVLDMPSLAGITVSHANSPSITIPLANPWEMVLALVYGNGLAGTPNPGWQIVANTTGAAAILSICPSSAGSFVATPLTYSGARDTAMIVIGILPMAAPVTPPLDANGVMVPAGLTELRPFSDSISGIQSAQGWGLNYVRGETIRIAWSDLQPNPPTGNPATDFNWLYIDTALALAAQNGKFIGMILGTGDLAPNWVLQSAIPLFVSTLAGQGPYPCPWDPAYQQILYYLVSSIAARYDSSPYFAYMNLSGFGWQDGMAFCRSDADNNALYASSFNGLTGLDLLYNAFQTICQMYLSVFKKTRLLAQFFSPIYPNNPTTELIAIQWSQWLLAFGAQTGIKYNNANTSQGPQDKPPEQMINNYATTNIGILQPQHSSPSDWSGGVAATTVNFRASVSETYIGQLTKDTRQTPDGFNVGISVALISQTIANFKSFLPQPPWTYTPTANPWGPANINQGGTFYLFDLLNKLYATGARMLVDVNGHYYPVATIQNSGNTNLLNSIVYFDPNSKRISSVTQFSPIDLRETNLWVYAGEYGTGLIPNPPQLAIPAPVQGEVAPFLYYVVSPV